MKQNDLLKIGTFSILYYLIFRTSHFILINSLVVINFKIQMEHEIMLLVLTGIITGIFPIITLIASINSTILKSIIPKFKTIFSLFIVLIVLTFIRVGIDIYRKQYMSISELGTFKEIYVNQLGWSIIFFPLISIALLVCYLIKLNTLEKQNLEKQFGILKVGMSSVLCYWVFEKVLLIFNAILTWVYALLKISNEFIMLGINILFGFLSILILSSMYNSLLKNRIPSKKVVYKLLSVGALLSLLLVSNPSLIGQYIKYLSDEEFVNYMSLYDFKWRLELNYLIGFLGLIYFMWKLYAGKKINI